MPTNEQETEIELKLSKATLRRILKLKEGDILKGNESGRSYTATVTDSVVTISFIELVLVEFDISDFEPIRNKGYE